MTYAKPEIVSLGDAIRIIQGSKQIGADATVPPTARKVAYSELDD